MQRLDTEQDLKAAVRWLSAREPRFAGIVARHGLPSLRHAEPDLASLLRIVTDQLISLKAGEAIWSRLATRLGRFAPADVLGTSEEALRALGLSGAKARTFHAAALAFGQGSLSDADGLGDAGLPVDAAVVGEENDDRVVREFERIERVEEPAQPSTQAEALGMQLRDRLLISSAAPASTWYCTTRGWSS